MIVGIDPGLTGAVAFLDGESYFVEDTNLVVKLVKWYYFCK